MAVAARTMRRVLVDHARGRRRQKRGGGAVKVELEDVAAVVSAPSVDVLDLHDVLERLAAFDARKAAIVELHFFGGLSYDETAEAVGVSAATVDRELRMAKAWLAASSRPPAPPRTRSEEPRSRRAHPMTPNVGPRCSSCSKRRSPWRTTRAAPTWTTRRPTPIWRRWCAACWRPTPPSAPAATISSAW